MVYLFIRNLFACQDGKFYNKCVSPFLPRSPSPCFLHGRYPCTPWRDSPPGPRSASSPTRCPPRCPSCGGSSSTVPLSKEQRHHIQLARSTIKDTLMRSAIESQWTTRQKPEGHGVEGVLQREHSTGFSVKQASWPKKKQASSFMSTVKELPCR